MRRRHFPWGTSNSWNHCRTALEKLAAQTIAVNAQHQIAQEQDHQPQSWAKDQHPGAVTRRKRRKKSCVILSSDKLIVTVILLTISILSALCNGAPINSNFVLKSRKSFQDGNISDRFSVYLHSPPSNNYYHNSVSYTHLTLPTIYSV